MCSKVETAARSCVKSAKYVNSVYYAREVGQTWASVIIRVYMGPIMLTELLMTGRHGASIHGFIAGQRLVACLVCIGIVLTAPPVLADDASGRSADVIQTRSDLDSSDDDASSRDVRAPDAANEAAGDALPGGDPGVAVESDSAGVTGRDMRDVIDRASAAVDEMIQVRPDPEAQAVEVLRQKAAEAAALARVEAQRAVSAEFDDLEVISARQAKFRKELAGRLEILDLRLEQVPGFRRLVRELRELKAPDAKSADALYDDLRSFLRSSRDELADALRELTADSAVPSVGSSIIQDVPPGVDTSALEQARRKVVQTAVELASDEQEYRQKRAAQLYEEVRALNADRLALLSILSEKRRAEITGFTRAGLDQAVAELRQVTLVLRYHLAATAAWFITLADGSVDRSDSLLATGTSAVKLLGLILLFWWWRRRSPELFDAWIERIVQRDRAARIPQVSAIHRLVVFVARARRPIEWLAFILVLVWVLPPVVRTRLEVVILKTVFVWTLCGAFVIGAIDALVAWPTVSRSGSGGTAATDAIRLRSLKLAGYTTVILGLILTIGSQLVGKGTIYRWVIWVCWFSVIPVILVIIRWWRDVIFDRIQASRRRTSFQDWVAQRRKGWKSFPAAVSGGIYLFISGAYWIIRGWITGFDLARRAHAWFFRRGMDRMAGDQESGTVLMPIDPDVFDRLGPDRSSGTLISGASDARVMEIVKKIELRGGGLLAIVGERGAGKSRLLQRIRDGHPLSTLVECPVDGIEGLRATLAVALGLDPAASIQDCAVAAESRGDDSAILIDHANRLVLPVMGGLDGFDKFAGIARRHSERTTWILVFNEVIWQFFERSRGAYPVFDEVVRIEPWREEEIIALLRARSAQVHMEPSFEAVIDRPIRDGDSIDREEAVSRVARGYFRMLWDYADGNPGVALDVWRRQLGAGLDGKVFVRPFQVPDVRELERLSDEDVFVVRAIIQLEPAAVDDVVKASTRSQGRVLDLLRYGTARGWFEPVGDRYRVSWNWYRPVTRFLQRRHLLASFHRFGG